MAKTFLTNNKIYYNNVVKDSINIGFVEYSNFESEIDNLVVFNKLKVKNINYLEFKEGYVSVSGTFIYDSSINKEGLSKLYYDFDNINDIRKLLIGNYLICIKKNNYIYVFGDENNIYNINYFTKDDTWIISNSLFDIAKQIHKILIVNELNLIEEIFQNGIINNESIFTNIMKLMGTEYISIDLKTNIFKVENFNKLKPTTKKNTIGIENLVSTIKKNIMNINTNFKNISISMTGGLDSRIVLSSYMNSNIKPKIIYGVGNSSITNTHNNDLKINKIYEEKLKLKFTQLNWGTPNEIDTFWEFYLEKYGILSRIYGGSNNVFMSYEDIDNTDFIDFGYFGETLRNVDWIEDRKKNDFSLDEYLNDFYINKDLKYIITKDKYIEYKKHIYNKLLNICKENNINDTTYIHKNEFQIIHNEYRKSADNVLLNFINYNYYSINLLSIKSIQDCVLNLTYKEKLRSQVIIKLIKQMYPDILNIPIFSHRKMFRLNKIDLSLKEIKTDYFIAILKKIITKNIPNKNILNKVKYFYRKTTLNHYELSEIAIKQLCIKKLKNNIKFIDQEKYTGDIRHLLKYTQVIEMINSLKNKKE
jgi:hypothetical protein